eukprot:1028552-Rhodomonas_salina.1
MSAIVADAKQDRAFKLRVLSSQDMSMPLWDGERSFGHRTTCELRCPRNESAREPCKTMRAARGMKGGSEVPFCHFQYGKGRINEEWREALCVLRLDCRCDWYAYVVFAVYIPLCPAWIRA